jgi:hypothetical protein
MNLQPDQNPVLPVPLCISDGRAWLVLWKAELAWNAIAPPPINFPEKKTTILPDEPEKPKQEE